MSECAHLFTLHRDGLALGQIMVHFFIWVLQISLLNLKILLVFIQLFSQISAALADRRIENRHTLLQM